jgi:hypothetical protein
MRDFVSGNKAGWQWTMMIMQPQMVTGALVRTAMEQVRITKQLAALDRLRFAALAEGTAVQTLHIGPFAEEGPTVAKLHAHIAARGRSISGKHHEIYLSDVRRAAPAKWRTVIRQPFS